MLIFYIFRFLSASQSVAARKSSLPKLAWQFPDHALLASLLCAKKTISTHLTGGSRSLSGSPSLTLSQEMGHSTFIIEDSKWVFSGEANIDVENKCLCFLSLTNVDVNKNFPKPTQIRRHKQKVVAQPSLCLKPTTLPSWPLKQAWGVQCQVWAPKSLSFCPISWKGKSGKAFLNQDFERGNVRKCMKN